MNWKLLEESQGTHFQEIESTQTEIRLLKYLPGSWISADQQTLGRGRRDRKWFSFGESKMIFSGKISIPMENLHLPLISVLIANAVIKTLQFFYPEQKSHLKIKWPNDIYKNRKKIGGILIEAEIIENHALIMIGIGCNLISQEIPKEIEEIADTIDKDLTKQIPNETLYRKLIQCINSEIPNLFIPGPSNEGIHFAESYSLLHYATLEFTLEGQMIKAEVMGFNPLGHLIVRLENGLIRELIDSPEDLKIIQYGKS